MMPSRTYTLSATRSLGKGSS
jgi:hypothetical protein